MEYIGIDHYIHLGYLIFRWYKENKPFKGYRLYLFLLALYRYQGGAVYSLREPLAYSFTSKQTLIDRNRVLIRHGLLKKLKPGKYQLTDKGIGLCQDVLRYIASNFNLVGAVK